MHLFLPSFVFINILVETTLKALKFADRKFHIIVSEATDDTMKKFRNLACSEKQDRSEQEAQLTNELKGLERKLHFECLSQSEANYVVALITAAAEVLPNQGSLKDQRRGPLKNSVLHTLCSKAGLCLDGLTKREQLVDAILQHGKALTEKVINRGEQTVSKG